MRLAILLFLTSIAFHASGQRQKGTWQDYLSYTNASKIAVADNRIYCATVGGLFYLDTEDNSLNKVTTNNGLSDFGIQTIAWSKDKKVLVIAYKNSNIDLLYENRVVNLSDIKRKQMTADKTVNNITFSGNEAYLSCSFGIVVLNLDKNEVKATWYIGENGSQLRVNDFETAGDFFYAATDNGILKAEKNNPNLLDFNNWKRMDDIPRNNGRFNNLVIHSGKIVANYNQPDQYAADELYIFDGTSWKRYLSGIQYSTDIQVSGNTMILSGRAEVYIVDNNHNITLTFNSYRKNGQPVSTVDPKCAVVTTDGVLWIADIKKGLVKVSGANSEFLAPNGPLNNSMFSMLANGSDLLIASGGRTDSWVQIDNPANFQIFRNGKWKFFTQNEFQEMAGMYDITCFATNPANPNHFFAGSWGGGILEFKDDKLVNRFTPKNSMLQSALAVDPDVRFVRIGGLDFDSKGNLWITNSETAKNLLKLTADGQWESFALPEVANNRNIGQVLVTARDDKWIVVPRGHDMYVADKTGAKTKRLLVTSYFNNGKEEVFERMNDIYSIAEDNKGAIWIGTSMGVAVYFSPARIWDSGNFYATQPSLNLNDGLYHPLLESETVTAIAVDGANRKWLGTKNSGVYLVSEDGENELLHFTSDNSPLLSNTITSIVINQQNGEVFIGTKEGLISYQGEAIGGKSTYSDVYVYPNPVRETYHGPVTVTGLIENTDIRITDIAGNLVFKSKSLGGQAIWDGKTQNGNRAKTGVYLVFCTNIDGSETCITKIMFIH